MRDVYERLIAEGEAGIDRLILERTQEFLELDFKRKENANSGELSTNDRRMLAEALSGFANSAGGLLIVGVYARQGSDGVDCAQEAMPIADIRRFLADTNTEIGRLIQPRLDGVEVSAITSERLRGAGYLLLLIPRSERRPHRSEAKGQKGYYRRSGSAFFEMEHYDIEDSFRRSGAPSIDLSWANRYAAADGSSHVGLPTFGLQNNSEFTARFPYITIINPQGLFFERSRFDRNNGFKIIQDGANYHFIGGADSVVHPGMHYKVFDLMIQYSKKPPGDWMVGWRLVDEFEPYLDYIVGCEGGRAKRGRLTFPASSFSLPS